jgi:hypothetical protein
MLLLKDEEWGRKSDRWIAEKCGVSHPLVIKLRSELVTVTSSAPRIGQDGKTRKLPTKPAPVVHQCPRHDLDVTASPAPSRRAARSASALPTACPP